LRELARSGGVKTLHTNTACLHRIIIDVPCAAADDDDDDDGGGLA